MSVHQRFRRSTIALCGGVTRHMSLTSDSIADFEDRLNGLARRVAIIKDVLATLQSTHKREFDDIHGRIEDLDKVCIKRCATLSDLVDQQVNGISDYQQASELELSDMMKGARLATDAMRQEYKCHLKQTSADFDRKIDEMVQTTRSSIQQLHEILSDVKSRSSYMENNMERLFLKVQRASFTCAVQEARTRARASSQDSRGQYHSSNVTDTIDQQKIVAAQIMVESDVRLLLERGLVTREKQLKHIQQAQCSRGDYAGANLTASLRSRSVSLEP